MIDILKGWSCIVFKTGELESKSKLMIKIHTLKNTNLFLNVSSKVEKQEEALFNTASYLSP